MLDSFLRKLSKRAAPRLKADSQVRRASSGATPFQTVRRLTWPGAVLPGLVGIAAFLMMVPYQILDPRNIAWLASGDRGTNYLGWHTSDR